MVHVFQCGPPERTHVTSLINMFLSINMNHSASGFQTENTKGYAAICEPKLCDEIGFWKEKTHKASADSYLLLELRCQVCCKYLLIWLIQRVERVRSASYKFHLDCFSLTGCFRTEVRTLLLWGWTFSSAGPAHNTVSWVYRLCAATS